jgi:hypothetical protein
MSDSEQKCDNCNCLLANVEIYVLTKGIKEQTWCSECVQTFWQDLKSEGWVADDGTWSELGFDDGEESEEESEEEKTFLTYSAFVEMFEPSQDFSGYEDDEGIEILYKYVPCKNPAREAGGWCAFLWKPSSDIYDGKWIRQEYNGSSPFAMWWCQQAE